MADVQCTEPQGISEHVEPLADDSEGHDGDDSIVQHAATPGLAPIRISVI